MDIMWLVMNITLLISQIILLFILFKLFIFIKMKFICYYSYVIFAMKFMSTCNDYLNYDEIIICQLLVF